jgi:hypothetical protein
VHAEGLQSFAKLPRESLVQSAVSEAKVMQPEHRQLIAPAISLWAISFRAPRCSRAHTGAHRASHDPSCFLLAVRCPPSQLLAVTTIKAVEDSQPLCHFVDDPSKIAESTPRAHLARVSPRLTNEIIFLRVGTGLQNQA